MPAFPVDESTGHAVPTLRTLAFRTARVLLLCVAFPQFAVAQANLFTAMLRPSAPLAPKEYSECSALQHDLDTWQSVIEKQHQECLDANAADQKGDFDRVCSRSQCQLLHNWMMDARQYVTRESQVCAERVAAAQEALREERQRQLDSAQQDREAREAAKREKAERQQRELDRAQKDRDDRAKSEAENKKRASRSTSREDDREALRELARAQYEEAQRRKKELEDLNRKASDGRSKLEDLTAAKEKDLKTIDNTIGDLAKPKSDAQDSPSTGNEFDLSNVHADKQSGLSTDDTKPLRLTDESVRALQQQRDKLEATIQDVRDVKNVMLNKWGSQGLSDADRTKTAAALEAGKATIDAFGKLLDAVAPASVWKEAAHYSQVVVDVANYGKDLIDAYHNGTLSAGNPDLGAKAASLGNKTIESSSSASKDYLSTGLKGIEALEHAVQAIQAGTNDIELRNELATVTDPEDRAKREEQRRETVVEGAAQVLEATSDLVEVAGWKHGAGAAAALAGGAKGVGIATTLIEYNKQLETISDAAIQAEDLKSAIKDQLKSASDNIDARLARLQRQRDEIDKRLAALRATAP